VFLQDSSGGVLLVTQDAVDVQPGELVRAHGFLTREGPRVKLVQAVLQARGTGTMPDPIPPTVPLFQPDRTFARLVRFEGVVDDDAFREETYILHLHDGPARFQAVLPSAQRPEELAGLVPGTRVAVTGVAYQYPELMKDESAGPTIFLRSPADVDVIERPPAPSWWTAGRVGTLLATTAGILALGCLWVWLLRRQVRKQTDEIKAHYQREAQLESSLRQARKLEAVGRLASGIAHDFNNLLTVIIGNCELASLNLPPENPAFDVLEIIRHAGTRAADLTGQLLTFCRQRPVHLAPLDLNATLVESEKLLRRLIGEHIRLTTRYAETLPPVLADSGLLHQVVINLAANARDAMSSTGEILLTTEAVEMEGTPARVRLSVTDTGCGMDEATQLRIFEPFFTTKEPGRGTGLGLATVYGIVQTLAGTIHVRSGVGAGTTVTVELPAAQSAQALPVPAPPIVKRHGEGMVVLLAEDEEEVRKMCTATLELYGYRVLTADSPRAALEVAQATPGPIHILVSDIVMPGMTGRDLALALRKLRPGVHTLFMSAYPQEEVSRLVGDIADCNFIQKPFRPLDLVARLEDVLGHHDPATAAG
jgi:signal transduction histidine kinase